MPAFLHDIVVGIVTGVPMLIVIGPIALLLVDQGVRHGIRGGSPAPLGVALGDVALAVVVAVAGTALASVLTPVAGWFRLVAALLLAGLAVHAVHLARASGDRPGASGAGGGRLAVAGGGEAVVVEAVDVEVRPARLVSAFAALTIVNPLTLLVYVGLVVSGSAGVGTVGWVLGMGVASLVIHGGWVGVGHVVGTAMPDGAMRVVRYAAAGLLAGFAMHLLVG